jgi:hypothetical protein
MQRVRDTTAPAHCSHERAPLRASFDIGHDAEILQVNGPRAGGDE